DWAKRRWFLLALGVVALVGLRWAHTFEVYTGVDQRWCVLLVMFINGLTLETSRILAAMKRPSRVALGVFFSYFFVAALGYPASRLLSSFQPDFALGILVICAMPTTLASGIIWTRMANGNDAFSLVMTVVGHALCFLVTPTILSLTAGASVRLDPLDMMQKLFMVVVLPVVVAQALRQIPMVGRFGDRNKTRISTCAQILILNIIFVGIVEGALEMNRQGKQLEVSLFASLTALVVAVHTVAAFACYAGAKAFRWEREDRIAVVFNGSQKTLPAALYVCGEFFKGYPLAPIPCVMYHVCQLIIDAWLVEVAKGREKRSNAIAESTIPAGD
ncbi:MAG: bile acid:sodium symporter, partial [Armatimonadetes bacterium]|nr:bile acid:sodium symporter [Armatimonadota bacterium]